MRQAMYQKYGRVCPSLKPATLHFLYHDLTGDQSSATNLSEAEVDERMHLLLDMEDPSVITDLRHHNSGPNTRYEIFWNECEKLLNSDIGVAVDDRRHGSITHLARAISIRDLRDQVKMRVPPETSIPSLEWI